MTARRPTSRPSLAAHRTTIDLAQQLLRTAGAKRCGGVRQSEFDALMTQLDDLRDLVTWLERNQAEFRAWRAERTRKHED
ncbi:MAG: hypothetical protein WBO09_01655 [Methylocystis silviterrae]|uniref:hypothetical protein n=1 Tax=Methylocystis silviterrae TaxID=2743612 RepID=UPI003C7589C1